MCTSPMVAWRTGKGPLSFKSPKKGYNGKNIQGLLFTELEIPCGQCLECRIAQARDWAVRIIHDVEMESEINGRGSAFVTLTYNDENMPYVYEEKNGKQTKTERMTLRPDHLKKFLARLRENRRRNGEKKIRYFGAGEYGDINVRPHYHAIIIGCEFRDRYLYSTSKAGYEIYRSDLLEDLWTFGDSSISDVTFSSAEYCAKDVVKRIKASNHESHKKFLEKNGVSSIDEYYNGRIKEFSIKSRMPGLGARWIDKYYRDVFPHGKMPKINEVQGDVLR